ncbi:MAG TPA: hypothetical protein VHF25_01675, partial [Nitriliruptorales bacterium]|nr:hypothetical protein [Nitriliruptorales bacterium]
MLRAAYGYPCAALAAEDGDGRLTGVLPLVQKRGILTGRRYSSLPHTPICGPLATDVPTTRALLVAAAQPPGSGAPATLQLRTESPAIAELLPGMTCLPRAESYVVDLP